MLQLIIEAGLRSLGLALIVAAALWLLRVRNPHLERTAWRVVLLAALAMPVSMFLSRTPAAALIELPAVSVVRLTILAEQHWQHSTWLYVGTYWAVCGMLLLRLSSALLRAFTLRRQATKLATPWAAALDVRSCAHLRAPVTIATTILLPANHEQWTTLQRRAVLAHESAHVSHRDFIIGALAQLHRALFWFNPLAWWLPRRLALLSEHLSDDAALASLHDHRDYVHMLLEFASEQPRGAAAVAMARRATISQRIERILSQEHIAQRPAPATKVLVVTVLLAVMVVIAACSLGPIRGSYRLSPLRLVGQSQSSGILEPLNDMPPTSGMPVGVDQAPKSNPYMPLTQPEYPAESRLLSQQGTVIMRLYVLADGSVADVQIKESSGFANLDQAALLGTRSWRLDPATANGLPVAAWGEFAVTFRLVD